MAVPYGSATSGEKARGEIRKILQHFGCQSVGFMEDFEEHELILAFRHRGRSVQLRASAKGWAAAALAHQKKNGRAPKRAWLTEEKALEQGMIAVNSILRDWVKGQVTAIECGILSFEHVFMPYMLCHDGRPLVEHVQEKNLLAPPTEAA